MATANGYFPIPQDLVRELRYADTFTGEFRSSTPASEIARLEALGLAERGAHHLTEVGMAVRSWLFVGANRAVSEIERLLGR